MAELFGVQVPAISKHLKNIFHDGELEEQVVVSKMQSPVAQRLKLYIIKQIIYGTYNMEECTRWTNS